MCHLDLLIRIIQLNSELGGQNRLRRWWNCTVQSGLFGERRRLRPRWNEEDLGVEHIRVEGIVQGSSISVPRGVLLWVEVTEGVRRLEIRTVLREEESRLLLRFVFGRLEDKCYTCQ